MKTHLIVVRHAKPEPPGDYPDDDMRPLSDEGRDVQKRMAAYLHDMGVRVDIAYTSPFTRAKESAEILIDHLGGDLHSEAALGALFDEEFLLSRIAPGKTTLFVGHDPTLAQFVNRCVGTVSIPTGLVKSGAVFVTFEDTPLFGKGEIERYIRPEDVGRVIN